ATPGPLPPPVDNMDELWSPTERAGVEEALAYSVIGAPDVVERGLEAFIAETGANELMLTAQIYDHTARLRSFEIAAEIRRRIDARQPRSLLRSDASIALISLTRQRSPYNLSSRCKMIAMPSSLTPKSA